MKNRVVFLDRDGTINKDFGYVYEKKKLVFLPGVIEALQKLQLHGYKLIIVTNQSGIGRGYYTQKEYCDFTNYMLKELEKQNIQITDVYYCPHVSEDNCDCRKPKLKLFYDAIHKYNIDVDNSVVIGDNERDLSICKFENIKGILIYKSSQNYVCKKNLLDAVNYILNCGKG